jgi:hypothetical protein
MTSEASQPSAKRLNTGLLALSICLLAALPSSAQAQSWYRDAFLAPTNATTFESQQTKGVLKLGPVIVDISAQALLEYSDNVLLTPVGQEGLMMGVGLTFDAVWQAAKVQQIKLTGEVMRRQTLSGPGKDRQYLLLAPGSALRYTAYIKDIRLMPFLNLSRQLDPMASPTVNNTDTYEQASYDAGLQVDWNLHNLTLQLMILRGIKTMKSDSLEQTEIDRELLSARLLRTFSAALDIGADIFVIAQDYKNGPSDHSATESASVFSRWSMSKATQLKGSLGYSSMTYDHFSLAGDSSGRSAFFGEVEFSHRLRKNISYSMRVSQSVDDGTTSNYYKIWDFSFRPVFVVNEHTTLRLESGYQHVVESLATGEHAIRRNNSARLEFNLPSNFYLWTGFRDVNKTSTIPTRAYQQQNFEVNLRKQF